MPAADAITTSGHARLTGDLPRSIGFYTDVFGLTLMGEGEAGGCRAATVAIAYEGIVPHAEGGGSGGIYFTDPDGGRLEINSASGVEGRAPVSGAPTCGFF